MARLTGPDESYRLVYLPGSGASGAGLIGRLYADAAGTTPADLLDLNGNPVPVVGGAAQRTIDAYSKWPRVQYPDGVDTIYGSVNGGPIVPLLADVDGRIDALAAAIGGQVDTSGLAPLASPAFTGTPTAPTAAGGTSTTQLATTAFAVGEVAAEATARANADTSLSSSITAEATTRANADSALSTSIAAKPELSGATPTAVTAGASGAAGTSGAASHADHAHATPSTWAPAAHASSHAPAGTDPLSGLTSGNFAAGSVDGVAATASLRTLGTGAQQAAAGNDSRITGAVQVSTIDAKGDLLVGTADNTLARVAVGANGYTLIGSSGQTPGVDWGLPARPLASGYYRMTLGGASANVTANLGVERIQPIELPPGTSLVQAAISVVTAGPAGTVMRLGVRAENTSSGPGVNSLLADWGTVVADATGVKTLAISFTVPTGVKRVWLSATAQVATGPVIFGRGPAGSPTDVNTASNAFIAGIGACPFQTGVTGALPADFVLGGYSSGFIAVAVQAA